jgi:hypothetical protein
MDEKDRTCCARLEVPEHLVPILRRTAEEVLERACDAGGEWNDEIRDRVLDAARLVEVFDIAVLAPDRLGELARRTLEWAEPLVTPTTLDDVAAMVGRVGLARELIKLRDDARAIAEARQATARGHACRPADGA